MKQGSQPFLPLSFLLGLFLIFTPFTTISAQDEEDDAVEEIFWGDEEEDDAGFDEDFDFSEDEGEDDLEGFESRSGQPFRLYFKYYRILSRVREPPTPHL